MNRREGEREEMRYGKPDAEGVIDQVLAKYTVSYELLGGPSLSGRIAGALREAGLLEISTPASRDFSVSGDWTDIAPGIRVRLRDAPNEEDMEEYYEPHGVVILQVSSRGMPLTTAALAEVDRVQDEVRGNWSRGGDGAELEALRGLADALRRELGMQACGSGRLDSGAG